MILGHVGRPSQELGDSCALRKKMATVAVAPDCRLEKHKHA